MVGMEIDEEIEKVDFVILNVLFLIEVIMDVMVKEFLVELKGCSE